MGTAKIEIFQHDLYDPVVIVCAKNLQPVDLTAEDIVDVFAVGRQANAVKFRRPVDKREPNGAATMCWRKGDTDTLGLLAIEIEVLHTPNLDIDPDEQRPDTFRPKDVAGNVQVFSIVADYG